jgi:hypothetical protein
LVISTKNGLANKTTPTHLPHDRSLTAPYPMAPAGTRSGREYEKRATNRADGRG